VERQDRAADHLTGHDHEVNDLVFAKDGQTLYSASTDGTVRRWDVETGNPKGEPWLSPDKNAANAVALSPDGVRLAVGHEDGGTWIRDAATGSVLRKIETDDEVLSVAFSPDGDSLLVASSVENGVAEYYLESGEKSDNPYAGHTNYATAAGCSRTASSSSPPPRTAPPACGGPTTAPNSARRSPATYRRSRRQRSTARAGSW
jgi:WD40 repeat protein